MAREFDELIDVEGLDPDEIERLRRTHELLLRAGPPPELTPALEQPPVAVSAAAPPPDEGEILQFPLLPKRRAAAWAVLAAALAAAMFGAGYLVGDRGGDGSSFETRRVVPMRGDRGALASIRIGPRDEVGNWPMDFVVSGLPEQPPRGYYNLYLLRDGRPVILCGSFRVHEGATRVRFTVPYRIDETSQWVVTAQPPGVHDPGRVVLET